MKHIFLTGEIRVGKTTIIERIAGRKGLAARGFSTIAGGASADGRNDHIFIIPFGKSVDGASDTPPVADRNRSARCITTYPEIFDTVGVRILRDSKNANLIVMDELGFMEEDAKVFQNEVIHLLDGEVPVLGVIKPRSTPFLNRIRTHENVTVFHVRPDNRDAIYERLKEQWDV
jgi:nucleoside-triphosphatase